MTRNVTITQGEPDSDNSIELWVGHIHGEWRVLLISENNELNPNDLPTGAIEDWLLERVGELPETIEEARSDPRMYVSDRSKQCDMNRVNLSNNPVGHATYQEDDEEWIVEVLASDIASESLPYVQSIEQDQIWLYDETVTLQSGERVWKPQSRRLTAFTGIGETTVRKLGDDITRIEELLNVENGKLTEDIRSAVPARYHDTLRAEVRDWYRNSLSNRTTDEMDTIDEKCMRGDFDWMENPADINATADPKKMCLLLRDAADPNDRFRITTDKYGDLTIQVIEKSAGEPSLIGVRIEPETTPLGAKGIMEIPPPYRGKHPVMRDEQDLPDSHPAAGGGSDFDPILHRRKITEVETHESAS